MHRHCRRHRPHLYRTTHWGRLGMHRRCPHNRRSRCRPIRSHRAGTGRPRPGPRPHRHRHRTGHTPSRRRCRWAHRCRSSGHSDSSVHPYRPNHRRRHRHPHCSLPHHHLGQRAPPDRAGRHPPRHPTRHRRHRCRHCHRYRLHPCRRSR